MKIIVNGKLDGELSSQDRGFQYGDGIFETLAVENRVIKNWELHWKRLSEGCQRLFLPAPDEVQILSEISQILTSNGKEIVKIILSRGTGTRGYSFDEQILPTRVISAYPWPRHLEQNEANKINGIELFVCETRIAKQPALAGIKHLNRLENVLARHEWNSAQYAEGIMCDADNDVIEGTMSNIFMVSNGQLITSSLTQCGVNGVMRQRIIQIAKEKGMSVTVSQIKLNELMQAHEVFVCNSIIGIWPVKKIEDISFTCGLNTLTHQLKILLFNDHVYDVKLDSASASEIAGL